ncbi:hypothetical protein [Aquimarina sp. 2201CG14-23]|uniref:hypothetical protein n=1 Tax=Aquimarina mycalae TaxID=3040073 RepID=UPI0024782071|nr:hypothetical protein [Aquimarina sp. 2201CG14-23]MDH7446415.1 hypothetical protein [Aquimarina sp. 2201CG14-23]
MNWKKLLKILGYFILAILLFILSTIGYLYYQTKGKYAVNKEKYPQYIGKIDAEKAIKSKGFELCSGGKIRGYYHSAAPAIYKGSKLSFKNKILDSFNKNGYNDYGYLNLRFNVNCKGETGNVIVSELNTDLEPATLDQNLVNELFNLSVQSENWQITNEEDVNYYIYLLFKIEDGKVTEILP